LLTASSGPRNVSSVILADFTQKKNTFSSFNKKFRFGFIDRGFALNNNLWSGREYGPAL
jgi:hypothetical protein